MLVQTLEALRQEKQLGEELSASTQAKIMELATRASDLSSEVHKLCNDLMTLSESVKEEMEVRAKALATLAGDK